MNNNSLINNQIIINDKKTSQFIYTIIILLFSLVAIFSVKDDSLIIDEQAHLISGFTMLNDQYLNMNLEHPPLVKIVAAIPLVLANTQYIPSSDSLTNQWSESTKLFFKSGLDFDTLLFQCRIAVIIFNSILLLFLSRLIQKVIPSIYGILAFILIIFDPNFIAHSRYITTDIAISISTLLSLLSLYLYLKKPSGINMIWLILSLTGAILVKFSGILVYIFIITVLIISLLYQLILKSNIPAKNIGKKLLLIIFIPSAIVYLVYFIVNINTNPAHLDQLISNLNIDVQYKSFLNWLNEDIFGRPILSYMMGYLLVYFRAFDHDFINRQYLDGVFKVGEGWWEYFPLAFLYKATPVMILLLILGLIAFIINIIQKNKTDLAVKFILIFMLLYGFMSITSPLNIGIRHILNILILIPIFSILELKKFTFVKKYKFLEILVCFHLISAFWIYPHYLAYFNMFAGGPNQAFEHLGDSNVDWGNNLKRLSIWAKDNDIDKVYVDYWGKTPLNYYNEQDIFHVWHAEYGKPEGYLAVYPIWIKHSIWVKEKENLDYDYSFLNDLEPIVKIGYGIYVYKL